MNFKKLLINCNYAAREIYSILTLQREKKVANILLSNGLKIAAAESCTGGLVSSRLTDLSGASSYILQNFVTYANEAKIKLLNVKPETIQKYGVVSSEVALEMAKGLLDKYNCDIAISTTGISGPTGATSTKPIGLIYIGIVSKNNQKTYKFEANPLFCRRIMKYVFSNKVLDYLYEFLCRNVSTQTIIKEEEIRRI